MSKHSNKNSAIEKKEVKTAQELVRAGFINGVEMACISLNVNIDDESKFQQFAEKLYEEWIDIFKESRKE